MATNYEFFRDALLIWHAANPRYLPWKETSDPYKIWISEVILQQTRVKQGYDYYLSFINKFPTVDHLAKASLDEVMKQWEGLGYYTRARNLHIAAQQIVTEYKGVFPNTYEEIRTLKGVGPYTAAAISSFAFDLAHPVLDGNVYRVVSRYFGIEDPIDTLQGKKNIEAHLHPAFDAEKPAEFNQAIMNFGALQCTPKKPDCMFCPMQQNCYAYAKNLVPALPRKKGKTKVVERHLHYFFIRTDGHTYIRQRTEAGIWNMLWELPGIESGPDNYDEKINAFAKSLGVARKKLRSFDAIKHQLSHQKLFVTFHHSEPKQIDETLFSAFLRIPTAALKKYSFPIVIKKHILQELEMGIGSGLDIRV